MLNTALLILYPVSSIRYTCDIPRNGVSIIYFVLLELRLFFVDSALGAGVGAALGAGVGAALGAGVGAALGEIGRASCRERV